MSRRPLEWNDLFTQPAGWDGMPIQERQRWQRAATDFLAFMRDREAPLNAQAVHEWLLARLGSHTVGSTLADLGGLEQMLKQDAVKHWKRCQPLGVRRTLEAMHRRTSSASEPQRGPLAELIEPFVRYSESQRRGDRAEQPLWRLDRFLAERGVDSLAAVGPRLLTAFMATRRICRQSCALEVRAVRSFFRWLRRTGRLQAEPEALLAVKGPSSRHRPYIYSVKELASLLEAMRRFGGWEGITAFTLLHLIYACGLRISEALRLCPDDVDLDRRVLRIHKTKFRKSRQIPVGQRAAQYLRAYAQARQERFESPFRRHWRIASCFFVTPRGRAVPARWLRDRFRRACVQTGLSRSGRWMRIHDMRHSFAVHRLYKWYAQGVEPQTKLLLLSLYMGHVQVENTAHYLQTGQDLMRIASRQCAKDLDDVLQCWKDQNGN